MQENPLLLKLRELKNPIVCVCIGVLVGATIYFKDVTLLYLFIACIVLFLFFIFFRNTKLLITSLAILFGYFYLSFYTNYFNENLDYFLNKKCIFLGEVLSLPSVINDSSFYKKYFLKISHLLDTSGKEVIVKKLNVKVQVLGSHYEEYDSGDIVQITGYLKKPKSALLPGLFSEKRYLFARGVNYLLRAEPGTLVFIETPSKSYFTQSVNDIRNKLLLINSKYIPQYNLQIVNGIIFGSKASMISDDLKEKIRSLGLSHLTSASGFNVSVLTFGIFYIFNIFTKKIFFPSLLSIFTVLVYCALADYSSSIIRATAFIIMVLLGALFGKKLKLLPGVSLILLGFFVLNPVSLLDVGLQLSVLAFLGITLFVDSFTSLENNGYKLFWSIFIQTLLAQIMVIPLLVFYFHNIQLLGLLSNLIAIPLASLILIFGLIGLFISLFLNFEWINMIMCFILEIFSTLFIDWVNYLNKIPYKQIMLPNLNFYFLIWVYFVIIFSLLIFLVPNFKYLIKKISVLLSLSFVLIYVFTDNSKYLKVFFVPKYNQDAILVVFPKEQPIYFATKFDKKDYTNITEYLRVNNLPSDFFYYDLKRNQNNLANHPYFSEKENKISITYKDFSFEIIKNYKQKISSMSDCIKLPILKKNDPPLSTVFSSFPKYLVINDFKRLSKKSTLDIEWLKTHVKQALFISETGTITLVTDGDKNDQAISWEL